MRPFKFDFKEEATAAPPLAAAPSLLAICKIGMNQWFRISLK